MKKFWRLFAVLLAAAATALALGTFVPRPLWRTGTEPSGGTRRILVLNNPIHTDIAIPIDGAMRKRFRFLADAGIPVDAPAARYIVFGWGGRAFYIGTPTWSELRAMPLVKGLTLDVSVLHVDVAGAIAEPHPDVAGFDIDDAQFAALVDFVDASFQREPTGPVHVPDAGYGDYDGFYEANGYFTALAGCNTWTAAALRAAGLRTGWWNPLPVSLALSMRLYN